MNCMASLAKVLAALIKVAALVASVEAIVRLARFAWALVLKLGLVLGKRPRFAGRMAWAR